MWRNFSLIIFLTACALTPTATRPVQPIPRAHTPHPTEETPQPPTVSLTPTFAFPKEINAQIAAPMWEASHEVLREFKNNGGTVMAVATNTTPKLNTRASALFTLDGKSYRRSISVFDFPMQFIGARVFKVGGYRAPIIGELAPEAEVVVLYFVDLTNGEPQPLIFTVSYAGKITYGGYGWLTNNSDFFDAIPKFQQPTAKEIPPLLQKQIGKQFLVSPALWIDLQTAEILNSQYAQHSILYKAEAVRSAICLAPTLQKLNPENLTAFMPATLWETFKTDGALPPCVGLIGG